MVYLLQTDNQNTYILNPIKLIKWYAYAYSWGGWGGCRIGSRMRTSKTMGFNITQT